MQSATRGTLRLSYPLGRPVILAVSLLVVGWGACEFLARTGAVRSYLSAPSVGSRHRGFENRLALLDRLVEEEGAVECIFLGSSVVRDAVDPEVFAQAYNERTGEDVRCFNFGLGGLTAKSAGGLARLLVHEYHPGLLIYGTTARDYVAEEDMGEILHIPWTQYRLGVFSARGWLIHHSYAVRYFLNSSIWLDHFEHIRQKHETEQSCIPAFSRYGFFPGGSTAPDIDLPADPSEMPEWASVWTTRPENLAGLDELLGLNGQVVQVLVVEMPAHRTRIDYFEGDTKDYDKFVEQIGGYVEARGVSFWLTTPLGLVADDGWKDRFHLNASGAEVLSGWLGQRVGEAVELGVIESPTWGKSEVRSR